MSSDARTILGGLTLEFAQSVLESQPFSCFVGAVLTRVGPGLATIEVPIEEQLLQQDGHVHGGVLSYAADNAITFAGGMSLGPRVLTGGLAIEYVAPARGIRLRAEATTIHSTARRALVRCDVAVLSVDPEHEDEWVPCAFAQGTVVATSRNS